MRRQFIGTTVSLVALSILLSIPYVTSGFATNSNEQVSQAALHDAMRKLWEDHITWTRVFIISAVGDLPDKATATERLLQNQVDIGNAI